MNWKAILYYMPRAWLGGALGLLGLTLAITAVFDTSAIMGIFSPNVLLGTAINMNVLFFAFAFSFLAMQGQNDTRMTLTYALLFGGFTALSTIITMLLGPSIGSIVNMMLFLGVFFFGGNLLRNPAQMLQYGLIFAGGAIVFGAALAGLSGGLKFALMYGQFLAIAFGAYYCVKLTG